MKHGDLAALVTIRYDRPTATDPALHDYDISVDVPNQTTTPLSPAALVGALRGAANHLEAQYAGHLGAWNGGAGR